jgi:integrase/recombinase XerD
LVAQVFGKAKKERVAPIGKTELKTLETYVKAVRPFLLKTLETAALFIGYTGNRICYDTLREIVQFYADKAQIKENVTPHTFRRSCTTALVREGNLYHLKELLRHESLDTLKHYTKLTITDLKKPHAKCHPREKD